MILFISKKKLRNYQQKIEELQTLLDNQKTVITKLQQESEIFIDDLKIFQKKFDRRGQCIIEMANTIRSFLNKEQPARVNITRLLKKWEGIC